MGLLVLNDPTLTITYTGPAAVLLDDYLVAADIQRASETIDARTFAKPRRSRMGGGMDTITLALLWSPTMYAALVAHEAEVGELTFTPEVGGKTLTCDVRYSVAPVGQFRPGSKVEVDLVLGVLSDMDWSA